MKKANDFLYLQLADKIERLIEQGAYNLGDRLPSVRELHLEHGISISTALQVYTQLEKKGFVEARERSGYYVQFSQRARPRLPDVSAPTPTAGPVKINELVDIFQQQGNQRKNLIRLDAAAPHVSLLPLNKLHKALLQAARGYKPTLLSYSDVKGFEPLRRHIARRALAWKGSIPAEEVVVTNGAVEAINLCLRAVAQPGDTIAIESPTFFGLLMTIESLGMKALEIPTDPVSGVCLNKLEDAFRKRKIAACLFVTNYNHPLGSCMPDANKQALAGLLARYQVPLIEDDAYGDLHHGPERPATVKTYDREGLVLYCSSFSKFLAPGYRVGWTLPGKYRHKIEQLKFITSIHTSLLPQMAIYAYLESQRLDLHLKQLRNALSLQVMQMARAIQQHFPEDTQLTRPAGSFGLWTVLNEKIDTWVLHAKALEHRIGFMPGPLFTSQQKYRNCLRISAAVPWTEDISYTVQTLEKADQEKVGMDERPCIILLC